MSIRSAIVALTPPIIIRAAKQLLGVQAHAPEREPAMPFFSSPMIKAFSQCGEDLIMDAILGIPAHGFYVDIGANDPIFLSNTRRFYDRGWHGINVEPNPELYRVVSAGRPRDVNVNAGIGAQDGTLPFYRLEPHQLSTFDERIANDYLRDRPGTVIAEVVQVEVMTMASLLDSRLPKGTSIDFMSIDVEGRELDVLGSNDWTRWRPECVLVEVDHSGPDLVAFMESVQYDYVLCNGLNGLFIDSESALLRAS